MNAPLRYLSVCSGIEAATVAWHPLGWQAVGYAEINPFACRVLHHHYSSGRPRVMPSPDEPGLKLKERNARRAAARAVSRLPERANGVPNFGDFTAIDLRDIGLVDILVGGTPCQSFSVAGKRLSLADVRGNLSLAFTVLAHELARSHGLRWAAWENVPGVLSTPDNAFGCFLGGLVGSDDPLPLPRGAERWPDAGMVAGPRARAAWRIFDAQYFGLAQRRRRVFVVAGFVEGADPAAVLFERHGLRRHPPTRGEAGEDVAGTLEASLGRGRGAGTSPADLASCLNGHSEYGSDVPTLRAKGGDAGGGSEALLAFGGNRTSGPIDVATAVRSHGGPCGHIDFESETFVVGTLQANGKAAGSATQQDAECGMLVTHALRADGFDASEDGTGRGTPLVPVAFDCKAGGDTGFSIGELPGALRGAGHGGGHSAIAFDTTQITHPENRSNPQPGDPCHPLAAEGHVPAIATPILGGRARTSVEPMPILESGKRTGASSTCLKAGDGIGEPGDPMFTLGADSRHAVATAWAVRRLMPVETERLQGFKDGYTAIPDAADGPRYKTHGNSMAVPCMAWIGRRIAAVDAASRAADLEAAE